MDREEQIRRVAESVLNADQFVIDVVVSGRQAVPKVLLVVDGDRGIGIDDCADISRRLSKALDDAAFLGDNYTLEVSTPGVEHPLKLKRQYPKNIGRKLKIKLRESTIEGKLTEVTDDKLVLAQESGYGKKKEVKSVDVPFDEIEKAFVMVSFK